MIDSRKPVTLQRREYVLDAGLSLRDFSGVHINGNGATIRRAAPTRSLLSADYTGGVTLSIDNHTFAVGDRIAIATGSTIDEVTKNPRKVVSATEDSVTIEFAFNDHWPAQATVFKTFYLITGLPSHIPGGSNPGTIIENITFDGNAAENNINYGWVINGTIGLHGGMTSVIRNSRFVDIPNETIVGHGVSVHDNVFQRLNGSAFHLSVNDATVAINGLAEFRNNHVEDVNRAPRGANGHSEGAITFSWGGGNLTVADNYFYSESGNYGMLGTFTDSATNPDENLIVTGNTAYNFAYIIDLRPARNVLITDNTFVNMGVNDLSWINARPDIRLGCNTLLDGTELYIAPASMACN